MTFGVKSVTGSETATGKIFAQRQKAKGDPLFNLQQKQPVEKVPMYVLKAKNYEAGQHWFSKDTMRFFNSKVPDEVYKKGDEAYFISSEDNFDRSGRDFTIRKGNLKTGEVDTVGEFGQYKTKAEAQAELNKILKS